MLNELIGTKFKIIAGYASAGQTMQAVINREVDGTLNQTWDSVMATKPDLIRDGKLRILMQIAVHKFPKLGDTPFIMDYIKGEEERQVLSLLLANLEYGRAFVFPPGVPAAAVAEMREAFTKAARDAELVADADRQRLELDIAEGVDIQKFMSDTYRTAPHIVARARDVMSRADGR